MPQITVTRNEVLSLCRLEASDARAVADVDEAIAREVPAIETRIAPAHLTDPALTALLGRSFAKLVAAEVLDIRRREEGMAASFEGAGLSLGPAPDFAAHLRREAEQYLSPYLRRVVGVHAPSGPPPASGASQDARFGRGELSR